jgi:hypothetical protein
MGKRRAGFFDRARGKGSERDKADIDGSQVHKELEDGTKRRYGDAKRLWNEYVLLAAPFSPLPIKPALLIF